MRVKPQMMGLTTREINSLQPDEIDHFFELGQKWDLSETLSKGGSVIFPHTLTSTCGDQVAAAVTGCLDSGKKRVIVLGVLHSLNHQHLVDARLRLRMGEDVLNEPCRGIFGPMFSGEEPAWQQEYSLEGFRFLWDYEIKRRRLENPPELMIAYPCLSGSMPWSLKGIDLLKEHLPGSLVIATTDFCHHGAAYTRLPASPLLPISPEAEKFSINTIEMGLEIMGRQNHADFGKYCVAHGCDGYDVIDVLMYLLGPLKSKILDSRLVDTSYLYEGDPTPSWVAASLIELVPFSVVN
jgi:hypothetical protein